MAQSKVGGTTDGDTSPRSVERFDGNRNWYEIEPVYAADEHTGLLITETFYVVTESAANAKEHVLDDTGRDSVAEWLTVDEHDVAIPERVPDGPILLTVDEKNEFVHEQRDRQRAEADLPDGMSLPPDAGYLCYICGPVPYGRLEEAGVERDTNGRCDLCELPIVTGAKLLSKRDRGTILPDGNAFIKKSLRRRPESIPDRRERPEADDEESNGYRGVWTCNNPSLRDGEEHVLAETKASSLDELAEETGAHYHGSCVDCEDYHDHYEGSLDRVEHVEDGEVVDETSPETLVHEHGMADDYFEFEYSEADTDGEVGG